MTIEEQIEAYLNQEMTAEEQSQFEQLLQEDGNIREEFEAYKSMYTIFDESDWELADSATTAQKVEAYESFLKSDEGKLLADNIKNAEESYFKSKPKGKSRSLWLYVGAAAAVLLIAVSVVLQWSKPDALDLYASNKDWSDLPSLTVREGESDLSKAEALFVEGKYEKSLEVFEKYWANNADNPQVLLYIGVAHLELDQDAEALKFFEELRDSESLDAHKAYWYLALTYLKLNQEGKAVDALELLIKNSDYQNAEARNLLKEID